MGSSNWLCRGPFILCAATSIILSIFRPTFTGIVICGIGTLQISRVSSLKPTYVSSILTDYLRERLAKRMSIHGVLVEIKGMGVLLTGASQVGKSETALGLVHRGHRLIADDRVDAYQKDHDTVE